MKKVKTISELSNEELEKYTEIAMNSILMCDVFFDESEKREKESQKDEIFVLLKHLEAEIKNRRKL